MFEFPPDADERIDALSRNLGIALVPYEGRGFPYPLACGRFEGQLIVLCNHWTSRWRFGVFDISKGGLFVSQSEIDLMNKVPESRAIVVCSYLNVDCGRAVFTTAKRVESLGTRGDFFGKDGIFLHSSHWEHSLNKLLNDTAQRSFATNLGDRVITL